MSILIIGISVFLVVLGFLTKAYPGMISSYSVMTEEQKKHVDIKGLSTYIRNGMMIMAVIIPVGYFGFKSMGLRALSELVMLIVLLPGMFVLIYGSKRFDHNKNASNLAAYIALGLVIALMVFVFAFGTIPAKVQFSDSEVAFTGMYKTAFPKSTINSVEKLDRLPAIRYRVNGFSFAGIHKGKYKVENYGTCHLLIHSDKAPFVLITLDNTEKLIVNFKDSKDSEALYIQLENGAHSK